MDPAGRSSFFSPRQPTNSHLNRSPPAYPAAAAGFHLGGFSAGFVRRAQRFEAGRFHCCRCRGVGQFVPGMRCFAISTNFIAPFTDEFTPLRDRSGLNVRPLVTLPVNSQRRFLDRRLPVRFETDGCSDAGRASEVRTSIAGPSGTKTGLQTGNGIRTCNRLSFRSTAVQWLAIPAFSSCSGGRREMLAPNLRHSSLTAERWDDRWALFRR